MTEQRDKTASARISDIVEEAIAEAFAQTFGSKPPAAPLSRGGGR